MHVPASSRYVLIVCVTSCALSACTDLDPAHIAAPAASVVYSGLDRQLRGYLTEVGFTGRIASTLDARLGRRIDRQLADIGRMLCHSPTHGFGDSQPMAVGIDNNGIVGPGRSGPRNQRRSPSVINSVFYPTLMWNSRFNARSGDPFDNRAGFVFPEPEGTSLSYLPHLLTAQAFIPPTERVEAAGFVFPGDNDDIRSEVLRRLNEAEDYRQLFARVFPDVKAGGPISFDHFASAIAEFEFTQVYANAPIDRYARGNANALTRPQKLGAVLFFGRAGCVQCHAVSGRSNEMFSDFRQHVAGIPQVAPAFGNVEFDGPGGDEDFGLEQVTRDPADRYAFRTSPLRNVGLQAAFMHNGAFVRLEDAIRYHLDATNQATSYTTDLLPPDLRRPVGPMAPVLERLDPRLSAAVELTSPEFDALVEFVRYGLLDPDAVPQRLRRLIPEKLPSRRRNLIFQF